MYRWFRYTIGATLIAAAATWPWVTGMHDHIAWAIQHPDVQCGLWWPQQVAESVLALRNPFFDPDLLYPNGQDVTLLVWNLGVQLLFLPVHALADPLLGMNLVVFLTLVVNGVASAWAARAVTRSDIAGWAALVVATADLYAFGEGATGRPEQALWAPNVVYLAALTMLYRQPGRKRWIRTAAAALALSGAVYWFHAYFLVLLTVGVAVVRLVLRRLSARALLDCVQIALWSALFVLPFVLPVVLATIDGDSAYDAIRSTVSNSVAQQMSASVVPGHFLSPFAPAFEASRNAAPLLPVLLLAGLVRRRSRFVAVLGIAALLFAMGPLVGSVGVPMQLGSVKNGPPLRIGGGVVYLPGILLNVLPGYERFWWPYRWLGVALPAGVLCAGAWAARARGGRLLVCAFLTASVVHLAFSVRAGRRFMAPFVPPPPFVAISRLPHTAPVLVLGDGASLVGSQAFLEQPMDIGLASHVRDVVNVAPNAFADAVARGREPEGGLWTEETSLGYHYVVFHGVKPRSGGWPGDNASRALRTPIYSGPYATVWAVPGVSEAPPGMDGLPEMPRER
jgi:hypothetical protein